MAIINDTQPRETNVRNGANLAKLAAKMAHELNNPLDAVLRFVSLAYCARPRPAIIPIWNGTWPMAHFGLQRMTEILRGAMDVGRDTHDAPTRPQMLPLSELISHAMRTTAAQAEQKHVAIQVDNSLPNNFFPR